MSETMTAEQPQQPQEPANNQRNGILWKVTIIFLLIALGWFFYWFLYLQYHEYTDDAYGNGNLVNITAAVPGAVVAYYADDTDYVQEGQLLVSLDDTDYRLKYEKELVTLAATALQVRQIYDNVDAAEAVVEGKKTALSKARFDYENRAGLIGIKAVSNEDFVHSQDNLRIAETDLKQALAQLQVAIDAAGTTAPEQHPLIEKQKAIVREAYYGLYHCSIYAPSTGYVAQRKVQAGQWVAQNTNLMAVIPTDYVWVDANFKETQLTNMRVGQPAEVWFDLYGSHVRFKGKVLGIASGTGSVFSIIPPQNATGNWIKIVQRLPVRVSLDPEEVKNHPIRVGISAEVDVDITNQELPYLTSQAPLRAVAKTRVFEIDFSAVDLLMHEIISVYLLN